MKKIVVVSSIVFSLLSCASAKQNEINQKLDAKSDKEIVLVNVVNDSRCPEGVQCFWAGEVTIDVAAYENKKLVEQVQWVINKTTVDEVNAWFVKHLPERKEKLKGIVVTPYPKEGNTIEPKDYKIVLNY